MKYFYKDLKNKIDFFLRQKITFSRKNYFEKNESKENIFVEEHLITREQELIQKYDFQNEKNDSSIHNYKDNLYLLDILDKYFSIKYKKDLNVLDIGCKNWFYAKGEYYFFKKYCNNLMINGIEIDANRLYSNLFNRKEVAKFYIQNLEGAKYIHDDFLNHSIKYDYITWLLPFIVKEPLLKWGLPLEYFKPEKMLMHAYDLLKKDGQLFVINQGEVEYQIQTKLCSKLNIKYTEIGEVKSDFANYKYPRYAILIKK